jgi:hypothetical protein
MPLATALSPEEFTSLLEVAKGFNQDCIPLDHAQRLIDLKLIYKLLGFLNITGAGRARIAGGS